MEGPLQYCEIYLQELDQLLIRNTGEKSTPTLRQEEGRRIHWKYTRVILPS